MFILALCINVKNYKHSSVKQYYDIAIQWEIIYPFTIMCLNNFILFFVCLNNFKDKRQSQYNANKVKKQDLKL